MNITWWGHSTATLDDRGVRLLTDPVLTDRVGHLRRRRGPTPPAAARAADAVLISHLHADHLHIPSLRLLPPATPLIAPRGTAAFLASAGRHALAARCVELTPGAGTTVGDLTVRAVHAAHSGRRTPWSKHEAPALGYVVTGGSTVWFAGDTDLYDAMTDLAPLDAALIPIGGWGPTLGPGHLDPERAAEAIRRTSPAVAIPIHFGTLWPIGLDKVRPELFQGPEQTFTTTTTRTAPNTNVRVLTPGETTTLP